MLTLPSTITSLQNTKRFEDISHTLPYDLKMTSTPHREDLSPSCLHLLLISLIILKIELARLRDRQEVELSILQEFQSRCCGCSCFVDTIHLDAMARRSHMKTPVPAKISSSLVLSISHTYQALLTNVGCVFMASSQHLTTISIHPSASTGRSMCHVRQA